jgi:hypothetical protein
MILMVTMVSMLTIVIDTYVWHRMERYNEEEGCHVCGLLNRRGRFSGLWDFGLKRWAIMPMGDCIISR